MSKSYGEIYSPEQNRRAVIVGALVTLVGTGTLFALPFFVPMGQLRSAYFDLTGEWLFGNPFQTLRFLNGPIAGLVTAYLSRGLWHNSVVNAVKGVSLGIAGLYCLVVCYYLGMSLLVWETFPIYQTVVVPLITGLPIALVSIFGGALGGLLGHGLYSFRHSDPVVNE